MWAAYQGLVPELVAMPRLMLVVGIAVFAFTFGVLWYRQHPPQTHPGRGTPWTVLQDIEQQHRGDAPHDTPLLIKHPQDSGYLVLGLPTGDARFPWTWLLLNEHGADHTSEMSQPASQPKMMPANARFHVDCAYVDTLLTETPVDRSVQGMLKRRCSRS